MQLWDIHTGKQVRPFQGGFGSLSPDGKTFATWDLKTNATCLWELSSEKLHFESTAEGSAPCWRVPRELKR